MSQDTQLFNHADYCVVMHRRRPVDVDTSGGRRARLGQNQDDPGRVRYGHGSMKNPDPYGNAGLITDESGDYALVVFFVDLPLDFCGAGAGAGAGFSVLGFCVSCFLAIRARARL